MVGRARAFGEGGRERWGQETGLEDCWGEEEWLAGAQGPAGWLMRTALSARYTWSWARQSSCGARQSPWREAGGTLGFWHHCSLLQSRRGEAGPQMMVLSLRQRHIWDTGTKDLLHARVYTISCYLVPPLSNCVPKRHEENEEFLWDSLWEKKNLQNP